MTALRRRRRAGVGAAATPPIETLSPYFYSWAGDPNYVPPADGAGTPRILNRGSTSTSGAYTSTTLGLVLPGVAGNYAQVVDSAALSITSSLTLIVHVTPADWTPLAVQELLSKWNFASQRSYLLRLATTGVIQFFTSVDGNATVSSVSTVAVGAADGTGRWIRVVFDDTANTTNFYTSTDSPATAIAAISWTQLGTANIAHATAGIFDSTSPVEVGTSSAGTTSPLVGSAARAAIINGAGTTVMDLDFRRPITNSFAGNMGTNTAVVLSTFNAAQATVADQPVYRASSIASRPAWDFVSSDFFAVAGTVSLTQAYSAVAVVNIDALAVSAILGANSAGTNARIGINATPNWVVNVDGVSLVNVGTPAIATRYLLTVVVSGASTTVYVNGVAVGTGTAAATALDQLVIGATRTAGVAGNFLDGQVGFMALFSGNVTTSPSWPAFQAWLLQHYRI